MNFSLLAKREPQPVDREFFSYFAATQAPVDAKDADALDYLRVEGLEGLLPTYEDPAAIDPYYPTSVDSSLPFAPKPADLARLHRLVRSRMALNVLEFGVGFSTLVLADALAKNEADFMRLKDRPKLRNRSPFQLHSVDASQKWIDHTRERLPSQLASRAHFLQSEVEIGTFNGRLCHYYEMLPNVVPDFIYLDGPSPKDVRGSVRGLDFSIDERTVMAADILLLESSLLPGAFILVDGRVNNARFLQRNFQRDFVHRHDAEGDITTFELNEPPLGRYSFDLGRLRTDSEQLRRTP